MAAHLPPAPVNTQLPPPVKPKRSGYAASPNLGAVLTQATVRTFNIPTSMISKLTGATGQAVSSIPADYLVDRVYSCNGPDSGMMVIEGHR